LIVRINAYKQERPMNDAKYIGLDVHQATISLAVLDWTGQLVMECIVKTKAATILPFFHGLRGSLHVTVEEGTMRGMAARFAQAPRHRSAGVRAAEKCTAESWELKRPHQCSEAG
jgi:hypothetical protein